MEKILEWVKSNKILTGVIAVVGTAALVFGVLLALNKNYIEFSVADKSVIEIEYGSGEEMQPVRAIYRGTIFNQKGTRVETSVEGQVEYDKLGEYEITYFAKYKDVTATSNVIVKVQDTQAPVITLVSNPEHYTSPVGTYQEEGYSAIDNFDGDITANVVAEEREGKVYYTVKDSSGNEATAEREIIYKDVIAPVITLSGGQVVTVYVGGTYSEAGYSAVDECDGDITANVTVEGTVDPQQVGTYQVVYRVADSNGNVGEIVRTVRVKSRVVPTGDKVIYLTFDDGPCAYTQQLLDVLDKYNVKATFFVTNQSPKYQYMIGETYRRGHTVAIHTYRHVYKEMYASVEAYFEDFNKIRDIIVQQTGVEPWLVRFPGGTDNAVSKVGMSVLIQELLARGYDYCDWNLSSGDASGKGTEQSVYNTVVNGCSKRNSTIVLQHDIHKFSVNAVDNIIEWGLANGYTFKAIDRDTPLVHYSPRY